MTGLRDSKKEAVRQRLYHAALKRFRADGYDATSVAAICADAGVAKGTFFNHFPNKADILAMWYDDAMIAADHANLDDETAPIAERLINRALSAVALARKDPELWQAKHAQVAASPAIQSTETSTDARVLDWSRTALQQSDDLKTNVDIDALADLYLAVVTGTIREWLNTGGHHSLEDRLRNRIQNLIGLATS